MASDKEVSFGFACPAGKYKNQYCPCNCGVKNRVRLRYDQRILKPSKPDILCRREHLKRYHCQSSKKFKEGTLSITEAKLKELWKDCKDSELDDITAWAHLHRHFWGDVEPKDMPPTFNPSDDAVKRVLDILRDVGVLTDDASVESWRPLVKSFLAYHGTYVGLKEFIVSQSLTTPSASSATAASPSSQDYNAQHWITTIDPTPADNSFQGDPEHYDEEHITDVYLNLL